MHFLSWRFTPRPIVVIITILFVAATLSLGIWQLNRAALRHQQFLQMQSAYSSAKALPQLSTKPFTRVRLQGVWDQAAPVVWLDNQIYQGQVGYHLYRVLLLPSGQRVLVNQGWFVKIPNKALPQVSAGPTSVIIEGVLQSFPSYRANQLPTPLHQEFIWQALPYAELAQAQVNKLWPLWIQQSNEGDDVYIRVPIVLDDLSHKNRAYAIQWFSFAAIAVCLLIGLNVRRYVPKS